jgi:hypothetical protein
LKRKPTISHPVDEKEICPLSVILTIPGRQIYLPAIAARMIFIKEKDEIDQLIYACLCRLWKVSERK